MRTEDLLTTKEYQGKFENWISVTSGRATAKRYSDALYAFFKILGGYPSNPSELMKFDVEQHKLRRLAQGVTAKTVNYEIAVLRAFYNWLVDLKFAPVGFRRNHRDHVHLQHQLPGFIAFVSPIHHQRNLDGHRT